GGRLRRRLAGPTAGLRLAAGLGPAAASAFRSRLGARLAFRRRLGLAGTRHRSPTALSASRALFGRSLLPGGLRCLRRRLVGPISAGDSLFQSLGHLVELALAVDDFQQPMVLVERDQRLGLLVVNPQTLLDRLLLVVRALVELVRRTGLAAG